MAREAVPDAVAPPPRHPRFALVDGMRAVAVLAVVTVHAAIAGRTGASVGGRLIAHLNVGVTIFFLISGFLLYRPFIANRTGGAAAPRTIDYVKRRFLRIYPAYWLVLTILAITPGVIVIVDGHWWPMYALVHTLPVYAGRRCVDLPQVCGLSQTWSLVVEVTFYAVLPAYAFIMAGVTKRISVRAWFRVELLVLSALSCLSVAFQFGPLSPAPSWVAFSVVGYFYWFALGMGMAVASVRFAHVERQPWWIRCVGAYPHLVWLAALVAYVLACLSLPASPFLFLRGQQLEAHLTFGIVAVLLLGPAVFQEHSGGFPRRFLARPTIAWFGLISYGIFLWHFVVTLQTGWQQGAGASFFVVLSATLAVSIPCAAASYYLVERPFLRLKYRRVRGRRRRPMA